MDVNGKLFTANKAGEQEPNGHYAPVSGEQPAALGMVCYAKLLTNIPTSLKYRLHIKESPPKPSKSYS